MSISTYAELKTAVANWLHRDDLTTIIPDFITLAETKLNRRLRLRAQENTATGSVAASISLPTGFIEMRSLTVTTGSTSYPLTYVPPNQLQSITGSPSKYTIIGDSLYFTPYSTAYTYSLVYYKPFDALSGSTNWLITNAPDIYLYATLLEAAPYIQDDPRLAVWEGMLEKGIQAINQQDHGDRFGSDLIVSVN